VIKIFRLHRHEDVHGNSGTGPSVAIGVIWPNGKVALVWRTEVTSTTIFDSISNVEELHSHGGKTTIEYFEMSKPMMKALEAFIDGENGKKKSNGK